MKRPRWTSSGNTIYAGTRPIANISGPDTGIREDIEHAELIVRAVNAHEDLVMALEETLKALHVWAGGQAGTRADIWQLTRSAKQAAENALAKAKGT